MLTSPAAMSGMNMGTKKGETRSGPFRTYALQLSSYVCMPPMPLPMMTPVRSGEGNLPSSPACDTAWCAAAMANCAKRSYRRASFRSMYFSGSKPFTSQAKRTDSFWGSNFVIRAAPEVPASSALQVESTSVPTGVTRPRPVTTTRCGKLLPDLLVEVVHGIPHRAELLRVLVRDVDVELLLERHHELHRVQAVGAEILHEAGLAGELLALDAQLLDDDVLDLLFDVAHVVLDWSFPHTEVR